MTNPIQLIREFRKWRREKFYAELKLDFLRLKDIAEFPQYHEIMPEPGNTEYQNWIRGVMYGIYYRKEILKKIKI